MLKIFFGVAGVLFIGLGLFGGSVLEGFSGGDKSQSMALTQATGSESVETAGTEAVVTTASVSDNAASTTEAAAPQVVAASIATEANDLTIQQQSGEKLLGVVSLANESAESAGSTEQAEPVIAVADNSGGDGAEPIAPAQEAGDLVTMAEQAKSTDRNDQVNMAKAVLTSDKPAADGSVVVDIAEAGKALEVDTAIKTTVGDSGSNPLIVIKDKVNLRDGPSIDHPIVLTLQQGQELMEFKREGKWVHVGAYGTSGKIGWVHERLVGPVVR